MKGDNTAPVTWLAAILYLGPNMAEKGLAPPATRATKIDFPVDEVTVSVDEETGKSVLLIKRTRHVYTGVLGSANITISLPTSPPVLHRPQNQKKKSFNIFR